MVRLALTTARPAPIIRPTHNQPSPGNPTTAANIVTTKAFDDALFKACTQAENYAHALPAAEGRPPFMVVFDVGHVIELYAEFTCSGATYTPFPDPRSHRIRLAQLPTLPFAPVWNA